MTTVEAIKHLENMKWLKGYDNTKIDDIPLSNVIDDIIDILKEKQWISVELLSTRDALELLKEQEPIEPEEIINDKYTVGDSNRCCGWRCGECKEEIPGDANFCPYCGRAVKWDD